MLLIVGRRGYSTRDQIVAGMVRAHSWARQLRWRLRTWVPVVGEPQPSWIKSSGPVERALSRR